MCPSYGTALYHAFMAEPLQPSMRVVILHGKDAFTMQERLRRFQHALMAAHGEVSRFDFDGGSARLVDVLDELRTFGLLATHKLIVVDKADQFVSGEETRRALERYAESPMQEATLVLRSEAWRPGNLDKLVAKVGTVLKCEPPDAATAIAWCGRRAEKEHGIAIDDAAVEALVERVGSDLARLDTELAKFGAYLSSEPEGKRRVTRALVTALTGQSREEAAWEVQEAVLSGRAATAVRKVRELVEISQAPEQLLIWSLVDLSRKLHDAARMLAEGVPEQGVSRQVKLWGPSAAPTLRAARTLGPRRAAQLFDAAIDLDRRSKSGLAGELPRTLEAFVTSFSAALAPRAGRSAPTATR
jgi:DNA polymerase III delta subunit